MYARLCRSSSFSSSNLFNNFKFNSSINNSSRSTSSISMIRSFKKWNLIENNLKLLNAIGSNGIDNGSRYRFIYNNTKTSFSQLGITFNQKPQNNSQQKSNANNTTTTTKSTQDFRKLLSSVNLAKFASSKLLVSSPVTTTTGDVNQTGLFGIKELKTFEGFYDLKETAKQKVNSLLDKAINYDLKSQSVPANTTNSTENRGNLVQLFDDISNELCRVADLAEFVRTSHPDLNYREAANQTFGAISQIVEKLNTNIKLYNKLRETIELESTNPTMDECDKRIGKLFLIDFEQSGIHLDDKTRNQFVQVNDLLIDYLTRFQANTQTPSQISSKNVNSKFSHLFKLYSDPITVDTMYINSEDELLREFIYSSYLTKNDLQEAHFQSIIRLRKRLANLCDFETYSHRANLTMIMETPKNVVDFLDSCSKANWSKAQDEFEQIRQFKRTKLKSDKPLMQWDVPYLTNLMKRDFLQMDRHQYTSYFSLGSCMEGLNIILNHLYDVQLEVVEGEQGEMWHSDIYKLAVKDAKMGLLGYIYCDFYQRSEKFSTVDCHFTIQCSKLLENGTYQLPIVVLHLNFPPPSADTPTLLTFEMMENLFHEFGHAMHSMFAKTRHQHVSGTRCSTDLAEVPSQLMEYYCREPKILKLFTKHYATCEPLDEAVLEKLCNSRKLFTACDLQSQLLSSLLDQAFHTIDFDKSSLKPIDIVKEYTNKYYSLPFVENAHWHHRFSHLVGYGAKYYSYLVSKAIAARIWTDCFEKDPLSRTAGENYRKKLLEFGGERRPHELISSLIGFDLNNESLVKSLTNIDK